MITIRTRWHAAQILRHERERQRLTRVELARRLFVSPKTIQSREIGALGMATDVLIDTAHALGLTVTLMPTHAGHRDTGTGWPA